MSGGVCIPEFGANCQQWTTSDSFGPEGHSMGVQAHCASTRDRLPSCIISSDSLLCSCKVEHQTGLWHASLSSCLKKSSGFRWNMWAKLSSWYEFQHMCASLFRSVLDARARQDAPTDPWLTRCCKQHNNDFQLVYHLHPESAGLQVFEASSPRGQPALPVQPHERD